MIVKQCACVWRIPSRCILSRSARMCKKALWLVSDLGWVAPFNLAFRLFQNNAKVL